MTKNTYKIDIDGMYYLTYAVYMDYITKGKKMPYGNLLDQINTYKMSGTKFDLSVHNIDDFMVDAYKIYEKFSQVDEKMDIPEVDLGFIKFNSDTIKNEINKIITAFDEIMFNCTFEGVQIRGIQKNFLQEKLNISIQNEEYEQSAILSAKIKSL